MQSPTDMKSDGIIEVINSQCPSLQSLFGAFDSDETADEIIAEIKAPNTIRKEFETMLLNGPIFSKKQLNEMSKTRKAINQWHIK